MDATIASLICSASVFMAGKRTGSLYPAKLEVAYSPGCIRSASVSIISVSFDSAEVQIQVKDLELAQKRLYRSCHCLGAELCISPKDGS